MDTVLDCGPAEQIDRDQLLIAAASANAGVLALIEAARGEVADAAAKFDTEETAEQLADALQTVLVVRLEDRVVSAECREMVGQLLAAVRRYLDGWA